MIYLGYWFMLLVAIIVATLAMTLGVGGALFFSPIFIIVFPIIGVRELSPADALGAALITELFGFTSGLIGYHRKRLIDFKTARFFIVISIPLAILGTILKRVFDANIVLFIFGIVLILLGTYTYYTGKINHLPEGQHTGEEGPKRQLIDIENNEYEYLVCNQAVGGILTSIGGFFTGLISVGIGETVITTLRNRCGLPMKVASGTSVLVVTVVVGMAVVGDIVYTGVESIPWELVMFTVPGVLIGGQLGPKVASRVSSETSEKLLIFTFFLIGFLMALKALDII